MFDERLGSLGCEPGCLLGCGVVQNGKKKCRTVKPIVLIDVRCCIRFLSATYAGKWHA